MVFSYITTAHNCSCVHSDEDYNMITRGRLLDRIRVALAGSIAVRVVLGEETNFGIADIKRAHRMVEKLVFYYGMSDFGITMWAKQPYSQVWQGNSVMGEKVYV